MPTINLTTANDTYTYDVAGTVALTVNGRGGNDTITTTANSGRSKINTLAGDDTVTTGAGHDTIQGGNGNNTINAGSGNNIVNTGEAGGGTAGAGDTAGTGDDSITTLGGADIIDAGNGNNTVSSGAGHDFVNTGRGSDMITTGAGNDIIKAGNGNDTMVGGTGNDTYDVNSAGDVVTEQFNGGIDKVRSAVSYLLGEDVENLTLTGTGATNGIGNALDNVLLGNAGNNSLNGGLGGDWLDGGGGADTLMGGGDGDTLVWNSQAVLMDGGSHNKDTLKVRGSGTQLDLRTLADGTIVDMERIDLTGNGNNKLKLNASEVLDLSSTANTLVVLGNAGDTVHRGNGWTQGADRMIEGATYDCYTKGLATLLVDADITSVI